MSGKVSSVTCPGHDVLCHYRLKDKWLWTQTSDIMNLKILFSFEVNQPRHFLSAPESW